MDRISSINGTCASSLGLAAYPDQDPKCVQRAFQCSINYFFVYSPGSKLFTKALKPLVEDAQLIECVSGRMRYPAKGKRFLSRRVTANATSKMEVIAANNPELDSGIIKTLETRIAWRLPLRLTLNAI
jgi:hypothetical protein